MFEPRPIVTSLGQPRLILDIPAIVVSVDLMYGAMQLPYELGTFLWWDLHSTSVDGSYWGLCPASFEAAIPPSETETQYWDRVIVKGTYSYHSTELIDSPILCFYPSSLVL